METTAPWSSDEKQPQNQVVVGTPKSQQQVLTGQVGQQVLYVPNPKFKPDTNFRHISYIVMTVGIGVYVLVGFFLFQEDLACGLCSFIWAIGLMLDAAYYNSKATWQSEQGQSTTKSIFGLLGNAIFGFICLAIAFFILLDTIGF
ncbi:MAG: hypothetical protein CMB26_05030 [Euryarchaeota archaeon]|nr:hypothetical protein [Euryarchaeota archaeon]